MKIAIGMIVRNLISAHPLTDFLDNAEKYDHPIERVIVVYSHEADPEAIQELQRRTKVSLIRLQSYENAFRFTRTFLSRRVCHSICWEACSI